MGELISRQAAIEALDMPDYENGEAYLQYVNDKRAIELVPSAQPDQQWTPCSERPPEVDGRYLVVERRLEWNGEKWNTVERREISVTIK